ncbi:hypothetical protein DSO57_1035156 [Entomophthora muscae]|uniref:Uncharacterized protein n=1 Tax=Entomophthora muscae TaxID=34485 RepID=A0ACC2SNQ5_9FUNG|nr:hypothetical protein DSO57_1035156 [Entomophthora muscae]
MLVLPRSTQHVAIYTFVFYVLTYFAGNFRRFNVHTKVFRWMMTVYPIVTALTRFQVTNLVPYLAKILPHFLGLYSSKKVKVLPLSIREAKGIPVYASCNVTIPPGAQVIHNTGLLLALPAGTHGEIFGIPNASRIEPWVAPGILMPSEKELLILLANMSCEAMVVSKHQLLAYIQLEGHDNLQENAPLRTSLSWVYPVSNH